MIALQIKDLQWLAADLRTDGEVTDPEHGDTHGNQREIFYALIVGIDDEPPARSSAHVNQKIHAEDEEDLPELDSLDNRPNFKQRRVAQGEIEQSSENNDKKKANQKTSLILHV